MGEDLDNNNLLSFATNLNLCKAKQNQKKRVKQLNKEIPVTSTKFKTAIKRRFFLKRLYSKCKFWR